MHDCPHRPIDRALRERRRALAAGATPEQLMEAIWVAAEMRAGAAWTHATVALDATDAARPEPAEGQPPG